MHTFPHIIAEIGPEEILRQVGFVIISLLTGWLGYIRGRKTEKGNRKDAARNALIGQIISFVHKSETTDDMFLLRNEAIKHIEAAFFDFAAMAKSSDAEKIQDALRRLRDIPHKDLVITSVRDYESVIDHQKFNDAKSLFCNSLNEIKQKAERA